MPIDRKDGGRGPEQVWHAGRPPGGDGAEGGGEGLGQVSLRSPGGGGGGFASRVKRDARSLGA